MHLVDFIEELDYLFVGFKNTVGEKIPDTMEENENCKFYLRKSQTLDDYVKKYKENKHPKFTLNNYKQLLYKCCYYIYPDKRGEEYETSKGDKVISLEEFSDRCVTLFFKLSGIHFSFLRIDRQKASEQFVRAQQQCLENIFFKTIGCFVCNELYLTKEDFQQALKMMYVSYRFKLCRVDIVYLLTNFYPYMENEIVDYISCTTTAYKELKAESKANYVVGKEEQTSRLKSWYYDGISAIYDKIADIQKIISAKKKEDVVKCQAMRCAEEPQVQLDEQSLAFWEELDKVYNANWKNFTIDETLSFTISACSMISSILYLENYAEACAELKAICNELWILSEEHFEDVTCSGFWKLVEEVHETYFYTLLWGGGIELHRILPDY